MPEGGVVHVGDCRTVLAAWPEECVDAVVCDPPYHLIELSRRYGANAGRAMPRPTKHPVYARHTAGFMGQTWDGGDVAFQVATWAKVLRVLRPGGHLVAFGGTRTYHRLACAVEDAGFEIRDQLAWMYGTGFPKGLNVGRCIDREVCERDGKHLLSAPRGRSLRDEEHVCARTSAGEQHDGENVALKPAYEPIVLARKPLSERNVAANVLKHGTAAVNVDACRIGTGAGGGREGEASVASRYADRGSTDFAPLPGVRGGSASGRWPANVILDPAAAALLDAQSGPRGALAQATSPRGVGTTKHVYGVRRARRDDAPFYGDAGGASRFFYCAKASRSERNLGLPPGVRNPHTTIKPIAVMQWLVQLVTPTGGLVLDPFLGSGTTAIAAERAGMRWVGVEESRAFAEIAALRIGSVAAVQLGEPAA